MKKNKEESMKKWLAILGTSTVSAVALAAWWAKVRGKQQVESKEEKEVTQADIGWG